MLPFLSPPVRPSARPAPLPPRAPISPYAFPSGEFSPVVLRSIFEGAPRNRPFKPHDVYADVWKVGYYGLVISLGYAVLNNAWEPQKGGFRGAIKAQAPTVGAILFTGPAIAIGEGVSANIRQRESAWNSFTGGFLGGLIVGALARNRQQQIGSAILFGLAAATNDFLPWKGIDGPLPYDPDMIIERDNDRLMSGMVLRKWEDIQPPPGQGYGIFPGWDRSYTTNARMHGVPVTPEEWATPQKRDEIWPKDGNRVLRPVKPKLPPLDLDIGA